MYVDNERKVSENTEDPNEKHLRLCIFLLWHNDTVKRYKDIHSNPRLCCCHVKINRLKMISKSLENVEDRNQNQENIALHCKATPHDIRCVGLCHLLK